VARFAAELIRRLHSGEEGQVTVEYAIVVSVIVGLLLGISTMVISGLSAHYRDITSVVCLPIP
jgi:Flp pilus assembly pilin Flp